jgi:AraC-like DNA-binding protein
MRSQVLSTSHGHVEQLQATASSILVPLRVTAPGETGFRADVAAASAGAVVLARIRSTPHAVSREPRAITSTDRDLFKLTLHRRGRAAVAQGDQRHRAGPGDLVVFDAARPYQLALIDPCDVVVVGLPRTMIGPHADLISRATATPMPTDAGLRAVTAAFLSDLGDRLDEPTGPAGVHLADALASLFIAAFAGTTAERVATATSLADRIVAYCLANLADPTLSVRSVAQRHGISPRRLHQLFRQRDRTFAAWLRRERLRRIRRDLADPALTHLSSAVIARRWGIADPGHLSRGLRAEFGVTATELRGATR